MSDARGRGRPRIFEDKVRLCISVERSLAERIDTVTDNRSDYVRKVVEEALERDHV